MKKFMRLLLAMTLVATCFITTTAFAANDDNMQPVIDEHTAVLVENGIPRLISAEEAEKLLAEEVVESVNTNIADETSIISTNAANSLNYRYVPSSTSTVLDYSQRKKVTPDHQGYCTITYGESYTFTRTFSAEIKIPLQNAVTASIGASVSGSNQASFSATYTVPAGKTGYVQFTPKIKKTYGTMQTLRNNVVTNTSSLTVNDPVLAGSFCDGLYQLVTT